MPATRLPWSILIRLVIVALHAVLMSATLAAQRHDIMISPPDRGYRMLDAAKVQAADSANGTVAVVWGTTEADSIESMHVALYVQVIRNGKAIGTPLRIGRPTSKLTGRVRIAALGD